MVLVYSVRYVPIQGAQDFQKGFGFGIGRLDWEMEIDGEWVLSIFLFFCVYLQRSGRITFER